jgi:CcmD family protein
MKSNAYLTAAYIVTWVIHIGYILYLGSRARHVERELKELDATSQQHSNGSR